jgi:hypothetical protein
LHLSSSHLYHTFDSILVLSHGRALYSGKGGIEPATYLTSVAPPAPQPTRRLSTAHSPEQLENGKTTGNTEGVPPYHEGYNVADWLLEVASDPPLVLFQKQNQRERLEEERDEKRASGSASGSTGEVEKGVLEARRDGKRRSKYATSFLTQLQYLSGREWKILRR